MSGVPTYYTTPSGDLYDLFVHQFGVEAVRLHLVMQSIEYLYRYKLKGHALEDIDKVAWLMQRFQQFNEEAKPPAPQAQWRNYGASGPQDVSEDWDAPTVGDVSALTWPSPEQQREMQGGM